MHTVLGTAISYDPSLLEMDKLKPPHQESALNPDLIQVNQEVEVLLGSEGLLIGGPVLSSFGLFTT